MKKITNIAFFINSLNGGGAEKVLSLIANELVKNRKIIIITLDKYTHSIYELDKRIKVIYIGFKNDCDKSSINKISDFFKIPLKLAKIINKHKIDVVVSFLIRANLINSITTFISSHKLVLTEHSILSKEVSRNPAVRFFISLLFNRAKKIIVVSNCAGSDLTQNFKIKKSIITTIYNPIELDKINSLMFLKINNYIKRWINNTFTLCFVGRLEKSKNLDITIKAISKINNIQLLIIGHGSEENKLKKYSKDLNVENRVLFLGWVKNPYKYIHESNCLILPSKWESFGNVVFESVFCKTPVITSDIPALREVHYLLNKQTTLFKDNDLNDLVLKVNSLMKEKEIKRKNIAIGNKLNVKIVTKKYLSLISEI